METDFSQKIYFENYGAVSCFGYGREALFEGVFSGTSGIHPVTRFSTKKYSTLLGGEVLHWENALLKKEKNTWAFLWARLAIEECLASINPLPNPLPLVLGTTLGNMEKLGQSRFNYQQLADDLTQHFGFEGPTYTLNTACSSSLNTLSFGADLLRHHPEFPSVLVVGVDALSEFVFSGFSCLKALSPEKMRPFSQNRQGLHLSEGAGALFLSRQPSPDKLVFRAYGNAGDANHLTGPHPNGDGLVRAIHNCLNKAYVLPHQIQYINAHGTGTPYNDRMETIAFHRVFGERATRIPISSTKSMIGHALGAAGALETMVCLEALKRQIAPPTIHYQPDPECDLDYIPFHARPMVMQFCLKTASGFGGQNTAILLEKE